MLNIFDNNSNDGFTRGLVVVVVGVVEELELGAEAINGGSDTMKSRLPAALSPIVSAPSTIIASVACDVACAFTSLTEGKTLNRKVAWSANSTKKAWNPIVQLLDSENLVLREENEENPEKYLWQSFDYPSDTWLPGMKLGWDLKTGLERRMSPGELSWGVELHNYTETVIKKGTKKFLQTGPWNGLGFRGVPDLKDNPVYTYDFVINSNEVYFIFHLIKNSVISRGVLNENASSYERDIWVELDKKWITYISTPKDKCDTYNLCGPYGNCIIESNVSTTVPVRLMQTQMLKMEEVGRTMWFGDLIDIRRVAANGQDAYMQDVYIQMPASEQVNPKEVKDKKKMKVIVIVVVAIAVVFGVLLITYCICKRTNFREKLENNVMIDQNIKGQSEDVEVTFFTLATIAIATNNFSSNNKLGEDGFGLVYKVFTEVWTRIE
uniref:Uncharacterized protein n=1 Tax=Quercus lobata TaxID=97700 RepID=A0A7N2M8C9_QUELO